jgi:hypothetical protein
MENAITPEMSLPDRLDAVVDLMSKIQLLVPYFCGPRGQLCVWNMLQRANKKLKRKIREMNLDALYEGWDSGHDATTKVFVPSRVAKALASLQQLMDLLVRVGKKSPTQSARREVLQGEFLESTVELPTYSNARQATPDHSDYNPGHPPLQYDNDERFREHVRSIDFEDDSPLDHMFEEKSNSTAEQDTPSSTPGYDSRFL